MTNDPGYIISSFCSVGTCVTVRFTADAVLVTSNSPHEATTLAFTHDEWRAFVLGVKNDEFNV